MNKSRNSIANSKVSISSLQKACQNSHSISHSSTYSSPKPISEKKCANLNPRCKTQFIQTQIQLQIKIGYYHESWPYVVYKIQTYFFKIRMNKNIYAQNQKSSQKFNKIERIKLNEKPWKRLQAVKICNWNWKLQKKTYVTPCRFDQKPIIFQ